MFPIGASPDLVYADLDGPDHPICGSGELDDHYDDDDDYDDDLDGEDGYDDDLDGPDHPRSGGRDLGFNC